MCSLLMSNVIDIKVLFSKLTLCSNCILFTLLVREESTIPNGTRWSNAQHKTLERQNNSYSHIYSHSGGEWHCIPCTATLGLQSGTEQAGALGGRLCSNKRVGVIFGVTGLFEKTHGLAGKWICLVEGWEEGTVLADREPAQWGALHAKWCWEGCTCGKNGTSW